MVRRWKRVILEGVMICLLMTPVTTNAATNAELLNQNAKNMIAISNLLKESQGTLTKFSEMIKTINDGIKATHDNIHKISQAIRQTESHPQ